MQRERITSPANPVVRYARSLLRPRVRDRERAFLVEGPRIIQDALTAGIVPRVLFYVPDQLNPAELSLTNEAAHRGARVVAVTSPILALITDTVTPQGMVAIFRLPDLPLAIPKDQAPFFLVLDRIQDPGNVGTILRTALGAGVHAVFLTEGTADPFAPKVVRAAAGAHFRLPILPLDPAHPDPRILRCAQRLAAEVKSSHYYDAIDWTRDTVLVLGSEAHGISSALRPLLTGSVAIPLAGGLESLNVAIAGAILLFEAARQRRRR